jgi:hypothetical protein
MRVPALAAITIGLLLAASVPASAAAPPRTVRLVSGGKAAGFNIAFANAVSADGSRAVFSTDEPLVQADTNMTTDAYARDSNGTLQLIGTGKALGGSFYVGMSANGDRVWYTTTSRDLAQDVDNVADIYELRRDGTRRQISEGGAAGGPARFIDASDDGDHVLFDTVEKIAGTGDDDAFLDLYDRRGDGTLRLVTPGTTLGANADIDRRTVSADGSRVTFFTNEQLVLADTDIATDSYSVPTTGTGYTLVTPGTADSTTGFANRAGTRTWFTTMSKLVTADKDAAADVYERRSDGSIHLVSGGTAETPATLITALDDGSSVIFSTTEKLLGADGDVTGDDLYERRADGSLRLVSGGSTTAAAVFLGENADGSVVFRTDENLLPAADADGVSDVYLRRANGTLALLTPSTAAAVTPVPAPPIIPNGNARTVMDLVNDLPGDTNAVTDAYEATTDGLRLLATNVVDGTAASNAQSAASSTQSADGSRILFTTFTAIAGTGDIDTAEDVYEADFAVPVLSGVPTLAGSGKAGTTHTCTAPAAVGEGITILTTWLRDTTPIAGATAKTFKPGVAEAGHNLKCRITARNGAGADAADSTARRVGPAARATALAGFPIVGTTLGCTTFAGATSTTYAWKRGTRTVRGRRARTFKISKADLGKRLTCTATGKAGALSAVVTLRVTVPSRCTVPNVRGLTPAAAKTKLGNAGCRSRTSKVTGTGVAKGLVLGTSPARGAKRPNGARITIRVRR